MPELLYRSLAAKLVVGMPFKVCLTYFCWVNVVYLVRRYDMVSSLYSGSGNSRFNLTAKTSSGR